MKVKSSKSVCRLTYSILHSVFLFHFGRCQEEYLCLFFFISGFFSYFLRGDTLCVGALVITTIRMFMIFPSVLMICVFGSALHGPSVKLMGEADENVSVWKCCPPAREAHGAKGPARSDLRRCEISISTNSMGASIYIQ